MIVVRVMREPCDVGAEVAALSANGVGAVASFIGIVRGDGGLTALTLEHYPAMTEAALRALADEAVSRWSLGGVTLHHRVGRLIPGDPIVLVACASAHRQDALEACAFLIDRLKTDAPFWKRESFTDGREVWVEARGSDDAAAARWE
jgi:molybdopterin synthase catalytic subunit